MIHKQEASKDVFVIVRATKKERKEMKALAKQQGLSVSDMIRVAVKERAVKERAAKKIACGKQAMKRTDTILGTEAIIPD